MRVISASRRTDIPAFYTPWLLQRLRAGFCHVANPISGVIRRVSLQPEEVTALALWTRNPVPLLPHLPALQADGYCFYAHMTITGYARTLESRVPAVEEAIAAFHALAEVLDPRFVIWRYDPILLSPTMTAVDHVARFARLAGALAGTTRQCVVSFVDFYEKTTRNLAVLGGEWGNPPPAEQSPLLHALADIAAAHGMALSACCEGELLDLKVRQARCVDPELLRLLRPDVPAAKRAPSRPGCGCVESIDIGAYDTCAHGCAYCYATNHPALARQRLAEHDPEDSILWRPPTWRGRALPE